MGLIDLYRIVWRGESGSAVLEHGGLERAAIEAERRGSPGAAAVPPARDPSPIGAKIGHADRACDR